MPKTVYIAGPMRGLPYFNFPAFDAASADLRSQGFRVISPAEMDNNEGNFDPRKLPADYDWRKPPADFSMKDAVRRDVEAILQADAVCLLPGWQNSTGATAERAIAKWLGLEVFELAV